MKTLRQQIHNNLVALISLAVAVGALAYNTWRNETTEEQRNIRHASFRVLECLGELQQVADARYYYLPFDPDSGREGELRVHGFGNAAMVRDLMMLMPEPAPAAGEELHRLWGRHFNALDELDSGGGHSEAARAAEAALTGAIAAARAAVLEVLDGLD